MSFVMSVLPVYMILAIIGLIAGLIAKLTGRLFTGLELPTINYQRFKRHKKNAIISLIVFFLTISILLTRVLGAVTISPSSSTALLDFPTTFTVKGLTASTKYGVNIDGANETYFTSSSDGEASFTLAFSSVGIYTVTVVLYSTSAVQCTASVEVLDILNTWFLPMMLFVLQIMVFVGIVSGITVLFTRISKK